MTIPPKLFEEIINILILNGYIAITNDSQLVKDLDKYIFRYYKEFIGISIIRMMRVIKNYNRFILNNYKEILYILLN